MTHSASAELAQQRLLAGNHQNIVLDLDATLVHNIAGEECKTRTENKELLKGIYAVINANRVLHSIDHNIVGLKRMFLDEFLTYCCNRFKYVVVWSAGRFQYVQWVCNMIFLNQQKLPDLILTRNDTTFDDEHCSGLKDLKVVYNRIPAMNRTNTFVVDDVVSTTTNNPSNAIVITPCTEELMSNEEYCQRVGNNVKKPYPVDFTLLNLKSWFSNPHVTVSQDVRTLNKSNIFETERACQEATKGSLWERRPFF